MSSKISDLASKATPVSADTLPIVDSVGGLNKKITIGSMPISTAQQTAIDLKEASITATTSADYYRGDKTFQTLNKSAVGLGNVDNTSDANKPVSTSQQTAIDLNLLKSGGTMTGTLTSNVSSAASTPSITVIGSPHSAGSSTTNKPSILLEPSGTSSTGWSANGTMYGSNSETSFTGNHFDYQINGVSSHKFSGNITTPLFTTTIASGNAKWLITGMGNGNEFMVGATTTSTVPSHNYVSAGSNSVTVNAGNAGNGTVTLSGHVVVQNSKELRTSNSRPFMIPSESTGNVQARVTFGPTAIAGTSTSVGAFNFNGAVTGASTDSVLLAGVMSTQTLSLHTAGPLGIGKLFADSFTCTANNQTTSAIRIAPAAYTNSTFTGLTNRVLEITQPSSTFTGSGVANIALVTGGVLSTMTATTEAIDINLNLSRNVQWATGSIATQRAVVIQPPNYLFAGASTISDASTFDISGSPIAGVNATITRSWAARFSGNVAISSSLYVGAITTAPTSTIHSGGSFATAINTTAFTVNTTLDSTHSTARFNCTSGNLACTLPTASGCTGREYVVLKTDATANTVTISGIAGGPKVFSTQYAGFRIQSNGTDYNVVGAF